MTRRGTLQSLAIHAVVFGVGLWAYAKWIWLPGVSSLAFDLGGHHVELLAPRMLGLALVLPYLSFVIGLSLADLPKLQRFFGLVLRALLVAALTLAVARTSLTREVRRTATVFVVDVSDSVTDESIARARSLIEKSWRAKGDNLVRVVTVAQRPRLVATGDERTAPPLKRHGDGRPGGAGSGTNLQAAVQLAYGLYPPGYLRRMVILSDGNETTGSLLSEVRRARELDVRISAVTPSSQVPGDVIVKELVLPDRLKVGEPFKVRAHVWAARPTKAQVKLYQGEVLNGLDGVRTVELPAGDSEVVFPSIVRIPGDVTYSARLAPEGENRFTDNDRFAVTTTVPGRPTVLYLEGEPSRARYLQQALASNDFDVDARGPREMPSSREELERYDFIVMSDVGSEFVNLTQMQALEQAIRSGGVGFLMAGGDRSFGLGGYTGTRMEQILPVRFDVERRHDEPSLALVLVIDKSGSMSGAPIELAKEAAKATAELLGPDDYIEVVAFDSQPTRLVKMQSARSRIRILTDIARMTSGGGTAIFPALDQGYQDLSVTRARTRHIILMTDGQSPTEGISDLVQTAASEGITISTVGLGPQVDRALLEGIAESGGGRSYFTNDPYNIPRIFTKETSQVARSAVVEEWFQAHQVAPAQFLRGIDLASAPYLEGYVATKAKAEPAEVILASDYGEPILARWRVGLGWSMAWTSDVKNRWSVHWVGWPGFGKFWGQLVREHMRQRRRTLYDMRTEVADGRVHAIVDAIGEDDRFINELDSTLTIAEAGGPAGGARGQPWTRTEPMRQTAPGRYEADFPLDRYGSFALRATHRVEDRVVAESFAQLANPYPREYLATAPNPAVLSELARATKGRMDPTPQQTFDAFGEKLQFHQDLWPTLVGAALAFFLLDLIFRRVRVFDRKFKRPSA